MRSHCGFRDRPVAAMRRGFGTSLRLVWACALGLTLGASDPAWAVSAAPDGLEVTQPDGKTFRLHLRGDEFFSWHETAEGFAVLRDSSDGFWKYARPAAGRAAFEVVTKARVGSADPLGAGLARHALPDAAVLREALRVRRGALREEPVALPVPASAAGSLEVPDPEEPPLPPPQPIPVSGTKTIRNIVILASFSNHWNTAGSTVNAAYGRVAVSEYSNLFNQVNHTTDGAVGSVRDYYSEVSYGKLTVESVVTAWVKLPYNETYYGGDGGGVQDTNWLQMVSHAIDAADAAGFNFAQGDSDGDGWADCLTVLHSGHGQEFIGNPTTCLWSKQGEMGSVVTKDGIKIKRCHTEPALRGATTSTSIIRIGVICHEMGHFFGLSDLYDYSSKTDGIGRWGLMGSGNWNGSEGNRPAHFCAHSKYMLGFVNPVEAHSQAGTSLARVEDNAAVLLMRDGMSNGEYFLLENRAKTGFDNDSNIYPGMLIYHVDSKSANNDSNTWAHPLVKIEEADGDDSLGSYGSPQSEAGDVWTSTSGLSGGFRDQTANQTANAMHYQSSFYKRSDSSGSYSYLRVNNFSAAASVMSCSIQSLKTTVGSQTVNSSGYTVSWPACSQATQYEIQEGSRTTLTSLSDGAEDEDAMNATWYLAGDARRSSAGQRTGTYSYLFQFYSWSAMRWYSPVQSLTLQKPFTVTAGTAASFYLMSHLDGNAGSLKFQISKDSGNTWLTLGTYNGYVNSWSLYSYNYAALNAQGISAGDACVIRFVMNVEYGSGWSGFPEVGVAVDDLAVTGVAIGGHANWSSLASNVTGTSYAVPARTNGVYAYRVRAYANAAWQGYGTVGETTVIRPQVTLGVTGSPMSESNGVATVTANLSQTSAVPVFVYCGLSGSAVETNDYTVSAVPHTIVISPSGLSGSLTFTAVQDPLAETNETVVVDILGVLNGDESGQQQVTVTITDDDAPPGSFAEWALIYYPGVPKETVFVLDRNSDGVQNGFDYAFGSNLASNAPLLSIFALTNAPVVDIPKQLPSTAPYVDLLLEMTRKLNPASWSTNGIQAISPASEPADRSWHAPVLTGTNGFFRLRGILKP